MGKVVGVGVVGVEEDLTLAAVGDLAAEEKAEEGEAMVGVALWSKHSAYNVGIRTLRWACRRNQRFPFDSYSIDNR